MRNQSLMLALLGSMALQTAVGQTASHLVLSDPNPKPNEKITLTYNPAGTPVDGKTDLTTLVYFLDNKDFPVSDVELKPSGKLLKGEFTVPATAKAFFIKIAKDNAIDDNNEQGYISMVYKGDKPVEGAYASKAYVLFSGMGAALAKIKTDQLEAYSLYKKEFAAYPQSEKEYQSTYYSMLAGGKKSPDFAPELDQKLALLAKSGDEKELLLASNLYRRIKKTSQADSLTAVIKSKFPDGMLAKNEMGMAFNREKDLVKKEALYNDYIKKYPEDQAEKRSIQDNFRVQLASAFLQAGKIDDYRRIQGTIKDKSSLAGALNNVAYNWAKSGEHLDDAAALSKQSLDIMAAKIADPGTQPYSSPSTAKKNAQAGYDMYADSYAFILYKQNKFKEALAYQQPVYENSKGRDAEVNEHYAMILKANGDVKKAQTIIEAAVKEGKSSEPMHAALKEMYVKNKGSETGYDTYLATLKNASEVATRAKLAKEMINQTAPAFALKDFDGKEVSLASLKGKVVVIDFWATWCGPCKASFPGMQMAVNKYKDNPNVKFLFIDTWENGDSYLDGVKKFIADNKYSFHVLMDEKGSDGRQSKVVSTYKVDGIPTKFVIDATGNVRFKHVGFSGSDTGVFNEITAMVDMALNPDAITAAPKVTKLED